MTSSGWIIMLLSTGTVSLLFVWCIFKVLAVGNECEQVHDSEKEPPEAESLEDTSGRS